jgi:small conductance mechanosensitive channel
MPAMETEKLLALLAQKGAVFLVRSGGVLLAFVVAWMLAGWVSRAAGRGLRRTHLDETLVSFASAFLRYAIILGAFVACLGAVGFQTTTFAAVIGAAGVAIGLAFQNTLSNFAAGVMLLLFRPFKVGDTVRVANQLGVVNELELFTTRLTTPDNRKISVPNASIFNQVLENLSYHRTRRVELAVSTPIEADLDAAGRAFEAALGKLPHALPEPPPEAYINDLGVPATPGVNWQLRVWCNTEHYAATHQAAVRAAKRVLDELRPGKPNQ